MRCQSNFIQKIGWQPHVSQTTRLDIMQGISLIFIFMETPKDSHQREGKIILRYIAGTTNCGIMYASTKK